MLSDYQLTKLRETFESCSEMIKAEQSLRHSSLSMSEASREFRAQDSLINPENYYSFKWLNKKCFVYYELRSRTKLIDNQYADSYYRCYSVACIGFRPSFKELCWKGNPRFKGKVSLYGEFESLGEALIYFRYAVQSLILSEYKEAIIQNELF